MKPNAFSKRDRVLSSQRFGAVMRKGGCAADDCLVVFAEKLRDDPNYRDASSAANCRLGVTIPKKTGNAVERNRWKRWIREAFRTQRHLIPDGFDYVVRPKKGAVANWQTVRRSLPKLAKKAAVRSSR